MSTLVTRMVNSLLATMSTPNGALVSSGIVSAAAVKQFDNGTGAWQATKAVAFDQTLSAGNTVSYTLNNASLTDINGAACTFTSIKGFYLEIVSGAGTVNLLGTFNPHSATDPCAIRGLIAADVVSSARSVGVTIGGGNNTLSIAAAGGTVVVRIVLVGT